VRCSCKLCIAVSFLPIFSLPVGNSRAMTGVPEIHHIFVDHEFI
jgi:hypothetical protein